MSVRIKVFVTKNMKFRARVDDGINPTYEVTVGGVSWKKGKGLDHKDDISRKMKSIIGTLKSEYNKS
ncbi:hypothetical protein KAR91_55665 [Candidatus Pacearchaeota archaeon]|nr:hypothetical protein [Candidatus Pacearchaeota archaeon]